MTSSTRRQLLRAAPFGLLMGVPGVAQAQFDTSRTISLVVPYPAGGLTDSLAREIAAGLVARLRTSVVVDNRPGGASQIALNAIKAAQPDGHTILISDSTTLALNPALYSKLTYDPRTDLQLLTRLIIAPSLLVVPVNSPYRALGDLIDDARKSRDGLNYATQGPGQGGHLFGAGLSRFVKAPLNAVHYRGSAPGLTDTISGQVAFMYDAIGSSGPFVQGGQLRALAVGGTRERVPAYPSIPTLAEQGLEWEAPTFWWGAAVRQGTPPQIAEALRDAIVSVLEGEALVRKLAAQGIIVKTSSLAEGGSYIRDQMAYFKAIVDQTGITVD